MRSLVGINLSLSIIFFDIVYNPVIVIGTNNFVLCHEFHITVQFMFK